MSVTDITGYLYPDYVAQEAIAFETPDYAIGNPIVAELALTSGLGLPGEAMEARPFTIELGRGREVELAAARRGYAIRYAEPSSFLIVTDDPAAESTSPLTPCWIRGRLGLKHELLLRGIVDAVRILENAPVLRVRTLLRGLRTVRGRLYEIRGRSYAAWLQYRGSSSKTTYTNREISDIILNATDGLKLLSTDVDWSRVQYTGKTLASWTINYGTSLWDALTQLAALASDASTQWAVYVCNGEHGEPKPSVHFEKATFATNIIPVVNYRNVDMQSHEHHSIHLVTRFIVEYGTAASKGYLTKDDADAQAKYGIIPRFDPLALVEAEGLTRDTQAEADAFAALFLRYFSKPSRFFTIETPLELRWKPGQMIRFQDGRFRGRYLLTAIRHRLEPGRGHSRLTLFEL